MSWGKSSLKNGHEKYDQKMSSMAPLLHLNELKEQILGDGLGEDGVDAKIMHQCIKVM